MQDVDLHSLNISDQPVAKLRPNAPHVYEPPTVTTYTDEQLLEALGPAQAQSYGPPP